MSDKESKIIELVLESPPDVATPTSTFGTALFGEESLGTMAAKLVVMEALLKLMVRNIKFDEFMREILTSVMQVIKCEAGSIFEVNPTENNLFFRAATGRSSEQLTNFTIPIGQGIVGYVAESKQPLLVDNAKEDARHNRVIGKAVAFEAQNLIAVPIIIRGQTFGVIELLNRVGEPCFTPADQDLLVYFSEAISRTVEARLMINWKRSQPQTGEKKAA